jgi:hypothetical protein
MRMRWRTFCGVAEAACCRCAVTVAMVPHLPSADAPTATLRPNQAASRARAPRSTALDPTWPRPKDAHLSGRRLTLDTRLNQPLSPTERDPRALMADRTSPCRPGPRCHVAAPSFRLVLRRGGTAPRCSRACARSARGTRSDRERTHAPRASRGETEAMAGSTVIDVAISTRRTPSARDARFAGQPFLGCP